MTAPIRVVGLGPGDLDRLPQSVQELLADQAATVLLRTLEHPAARQLAERRTVHSCDDLYDTSDDLETVYRRIVDRLTSLSAAGPVVYAVPGSPRIGERSVVLLEALVAERGATLEVVPAESFLDLVLERLGLDPVAGGLQILDGRRLPDPLPLHLPTVVSQVDTPGVLDAVAGALGRVLDPTVPVVVLHELGTSGEVLMPVPVADLAGVTVGPRTTLFIDPPPAGWTGLVATMRRLRTECPWDRRQTHHSLSRHLVEETFEVVEALAALGPDAPAGDLDFGAYADLEEELGDVLLQVIFHATMAAEAGAFDIDDIAEQLRRKLVRRHPHVFADVEVSGADEVVRNWERIKAEEKQRTSLMDDVPSGLPALARAAKLQRRAASVGFDWDGPEPVYDKVDEELSELRSAPADRVADELGDVLFALVNLARHLTVDPDVALRRATDRFVERFRSMETTGDLSGKSLEELDRLWEAAKRALPGERSDP